MTCTAQFCLDRAVMCYLSGIGCLRSAVNAGTVQNIRQRPVLKYQTDKQTASHGNG